MIVIVVFGYESVNSSCAQALAFFIDLYGKFPGVGTLELSNPRKWERKERVNVPSSVSSHSQLMQFKHFNVPFFVSVYQYK